jgi:hypothetical protein
LLALLGTAARAEFRFTVSADPRDESAAFTSLLQSMVSHVGDEGSFHVSCGDIDPVGTNRSIIDSELGTGTLWYPGIGNHELPGDGSEAYYGANMDWLRAEYNTGNGVRTPLSAGVTTPGPTGGVETTYSWDYGGAHFVMLNQYYDGAGDTGTDGDVVPALRSWLEADLAAHAGSTVFVFGHEPAYPRHRHVGDSLDKYPANRDAFWNVLEQYDVEAYFCGHTHYYSTRRNPGGRTWQIDTGNAGNDPGDGKTFVDVTVGDAQVRYDVYRDEGTGTYALAETWSEPLDNPNPHHVTVTFSGAVDTYLQQAGPTADNSTDATLNVDADDPSGSGSDCQAVLRFENLFGSGEGQVPTDAEIVSAALVVETTNPGGGAALHRMLQGWSDTDNWSSFSADGTGGVQPGSEAATAADAQIGDLSSGSIPTGSTIIDVTASVEAWLADADPNAANLGWAVLPLGSTDGWDFYSGEGDIPPTLHVTYVPEPASLALLAIGGLLTLRRRR